MLTYSIKPDVNDTIEIELSSGLSNIHYAGFEVILYEKYIVKEFDGYYGYFINRHDLTFEKIKLISLKELDCTLDSQNNFVVTIFKDNSIWLFIPSDALNQYRLRLIANINQLTLLKNSNDSFLTYYNNIKDEHLDPIKEKSNELRKIVSSIYVKISKTIKGDDVDEMIKLNKSLLISILNEL